jgi:HD superfamily phosphohydrolase YqeK
MRTVKKLKMYLLIARDREEMISKIPTDLDSARQKHFIRVKNLSKIMMHCYKLSKTFTVNISGSKFGKTKKVEITKWDLC